MGTPRSGALADNGRRQDRGRQGKGQAEGEGEAARMIGYKAFDGDLRCCGRQYEVGMEYGEQGRGPWEQDLDLCFYESLTDLFRESSRTPCEVCVCEVEALGDVAMDYDEIGHWSTNRLRVVRRLTEEDACREANAGRDNTGYGNTGDCNSGAYNSGNGNSNDYNSGSCNSGGRNSGSQNSGSCNSGDRNSGHGNTGWYNSGLRNTGWHNRGSFNSGWWNLTDYSAGALCTEVPECLIFDRPSGMTFDEWRRGKAAKLLSDVPVDTNEWVPAGMMTDEEKASHPGWEIAGGYLQEGTYEHRFDSWWTGLDDDEKAEIFAIPNFDPDKFERITGLHVHGEMPKRKTGDDGRDVSGLVQSLNLLFVGWTGKEIAKAIEQATGKTLR